MYTYLKMSLNLRVSVLEKKMVRIEALLWYVAGTLSIKFGTEILPFVAAMI